MELQMFAPILGVVGFVIAIILYNVVKAEPVGNERMKEIGDDIYNGAMAFLGREYRVLAIFVAVVFCLIAVGMNKETAFCLPWWCSLFDDLRFYRYESSDSR